MHRMAAENALRFAKQAVGATSAAFYLVSDEELHDFLLDNMTFEFIEHYVVDMNRFDPLHVRHAASRPIARLREEFESAPSPATTLYERFCLKFDIEDSIEFFFRHEGRIFAGMNVAWADSSRIPPGVINLVRAMHGYIEYNLIQTIPQPAAHDNRYGLTPREEEVLQLLSCGRTNREIGDCLGLRLPTVKTHIAHIFEKLGVETRAAAVAMNLQARQRAGLTLPNARPDRV